MNPARTLRDILARKQLCVVPTAHDALSAHLIEEAGFEVAFVGGYAVSAAQLAMPDMSLLSYGELLQTGRTICERIRLPVIGDADTGFGNEMNVRRTVEGFARAGFAAVMIEDQVYPKRCGFLSGVEVVDRDETCRRIRAALAARDEFDGDILIVGRTDAAAPLGIDEAIWRAKAYEDMGCDIVYLEGAHTQQDLARFCREVSVPKLYVGGEGRAEPTLTHAQLRDLGYDLVVWALTLLNVSVKAMQGALATLKDDRVVTDIVPFEELSRVVGVNAYLDKMRE